MRHVRMLCISPIFPPAVNAEAFVTAKIVMALAGCGHDVTVITEPGALGKDARARDTSSLWHSLKSCTVAVDAPGNVRPLATVFYGLRYASARIYPRWIHRTLAVARRLHREKPFELVISRSLPMRAHIAGYWCARRLRLPWVAVVNDPWDRHLFPAARLKVSRLKRYVSNAWLHRTMRKADLVAFPCQRLAAFHIGLSGVTRETEILPHLGMTLAARRTDEGFRLVHAGMLGPNELSTGRPASGLLKGLARFLENRRDARDETTLTLIGPEDPDTGLWADELGLDDVVQSIGRRNYEETLGHIAAASVCVLVEEDMPEGIYLPSKFADYVAAGKHVLALSPEVGTVADMTPDAGLTRVDVHDADAIADAIDTLYEDYRAGKLDDRCPSPTLTEMFEPSCVVERLVSAVERVRSGRSTKTR